MHEVQAAFRQARYLTKVLVGLALLMLVVLVALGLPDAVMGATLRQCVIGVLLLAMLMQVPLSRWLYGRADELQQFMHRQASAHTLTWLAAGSGVAGVLQANGMIPDFNQFWMLGALIALWGVQLMLADRPHR